MKKFKVDEYLGKLRKKNIINQKLDALFHIELLLFFIYNGVKCDVCGHIQGNVDKKQGWKYCKHFSNRIGNRFNKERRILSEELFSKGFFDDLKGKFAQSNKEEQSSGGTK